MLEYLSSLTKFSEQQKKEKPQRKSWSLWDSNSCLLTQFDLKHFWLQRNDSLTHLLDVQVILIEASVQLTVTAVSFWFTQTCFTITCITHIQYSFSTAYTSNQILLILLQNRFVLNMYIEHKLRTTSYLYPYWVIYSNNSVVHWTVEFKS